MSLGLSQRLQAGIVWLGRKDLFQLYVVVYAVFYVLVSFGLEHGLGIIGFSKTPYLNGGGYLYALAFVALAFLTNRVRLSFFAFGPLTVLVLVSLFASSVIGFANHNAVTYIAAWNLYILTAILLFSLFRHNRDPEGAWRDSTGVIFSKPFLLFVLAAAFASIFSKDNQYQYVLTEVIAIYAMLIRPGLIDKGLGLLIYLMVHLGSNSGFVQVEINRASILAAGLAGLLFLIYRRYFITTVFLIFATLGGLAYAVSMDDATVESLPRNISEAIMLMKGDDIYNHVSSYQRIYEGQKVMEDFRDASTMETLFGKGLGRTVDMTGAADSTVGQHALLGVLDVHNIHFINYAILHKFGYFGLGVFGLIVIAILAMFASDFASRRLDDALMFFYFYIFYNLMFAMPASNHLIGNPLWPAFLGMLCYLRKKPRLSIP